jgi:hypothetical protein
MRIRLQDPSLLDDLIAYLRRCECDAAVVGADVVEVRFNGSVSRLAAMSFVESGLCYSCGNEIALVLRQLGSTLCHDCRGGRGNGSPSEYASEKLRARWARMELEAYMKVWGAVHPGSVPELIE